MNRRLIALTAVFLLGALGSILLGFSRSLAAIHLQEVRLPGGGVFSVDTPGTWLLWSGTKRGGRVSFADTTAVVKPSAVSPTETVLEAAPTARQIRFTRPYEPTLGGEMCWMTVARFDIEQSGSWSLQGAPGVWGVSPDPLNSMKWWALGSTSLAIVLVGAAACTGWIAFKRPQHGHLSSFRAPSGG